MIRFLLCIFLVFNISVSPAQELEPLIPSQRVTFGNNTHTNRNALFFSELNNRGQLIVAGTTEKDFSFTDVQVKALNSNLEVLWTVERSWDGISYDYPMDVLIDKEDHVWVVSKNVINLYEAHFVITRIDPQGKVLWEYISPEPLETSTLNMNQYFYYFSEEGHLNFFYSQTGDGYPGTPNFFRISPAGEIYGEYQKDLRIHHLSQHQGIYHGISYEEEENKLYYLRFNESNTEKIHLSHEAFANAPNFIYEENSGVSTDRAGNLIFIGQGNFHNDNSYLHKGSIIFSVAPTGELNYVIPHNGAIDKYLLGFRIDEQNNLVLLSNTQPTQTSGEPLLTLEIFSEDGELLFHKVDESAVGSLTLMDEEQILVHKLDGNIASYDYKLEELRLYEVEPIEKVFMSQGLQFLDGLPVLIGTTLERAYLNSDYMSLQDNLVRKFTTTGEVARMTYRGEGTSKLYTYSMDKNEQGNYLVQALEFLGPDNIARGGSRSPKEKKVLTYNPQLEFLGVEIVEEHEEWQEGANEFIAENGDVFLYELAEDRKGVKFFRNNILVWQRQLNFEAFQGRVDREGNFIITSIRYGGNLKDISKFTPQNEYSSAKAGEQIINFIVLSNNWIFAYLNDYSINIYSPELELINSRKPPFEETEEEFAPYLIEKNNKVLFNVRHLKQVNVYDHYGNLVNKFKLDGIFHPSNILFDEQDALVVYHTIGTGIPLQHAYNWSRGALSRYENVVADFIGGLPEGDSDQDGVPDMYDQCPDTPLGTEINEKGCLLIQLEADHFTLRIKNETCVGKNNGTLEINAADEAAYELVMNGVIHNFSRVFTAEGLAPGNYEVCVWLKGEVQTRRCYGFEIKGGEELLAQTRISAGIQRKELEVDINSGTAPFQVKINGIAAGSFEASSFRIPVYSGDEVTVSSAVACEGELSVNIEGAGGIWLYQNPVEAEIQLLLPEVQQQKFLIEIYNSSGQKIKSLWYNSRSRELKIPASNLSKGVYFLRIYLDEVKTIKMLKS